MNRRKRDWYGPSLVGVQVHLEPFITCTQQEQHQDLRISPQWPLKRRHRHRYPLPRSQDSQTATLPLVPTGDDSTAQRAAKLVEKHLNAVAREKPRRHPPSDRPFRPLVLSLGGMMEKDATDAPKLWKSAMTVEYTPCLVRRLSLGLLRERARSCALLQAISSLDE
jgi:hypothetical protein